MASALVTELAHLAGHLELAADPAAAREAALLRRAIASINGLTDELAPYRAFHSDAKSYDQIDWAKVSAPDWKPDEPNAHVEGAPV